MEDASLFAGGVGVVKAKKAKQQPKYVAEPVAEPVDNFTLPEAALRKTPEPSITKAAERERNRQLQAEAEAKKKKREVEKAKRKARAEQLEKEALVKAKAAAAAALRGTPIGKEASKKAAEAAAELAAASEAAAAAKQKDNEDEEEDAYDFSNPVLTGPRKATQLLKAGAAAPTAKRPRNWRRGIFDQIQDFVQDLTEPENRVWAAMIVLFVLLAYNYFN
jgi:hypothetical protein